MKANEDLRAYAKENGVKLWEVAAELHYHEGTLCKHLRFELPEEEKKLAFAAIKAIKKRRG